jgi:hypothetical protein
MLLALAHDGRAETGAEIFRQFVKLGIAVNLNCFFGGVANHIAIVTPGEMVFQLALGLLVEDTVEIVG